MVDEYDEIEKEIALIKSIDYNSYKDLDFLFYKKNTNEIVAIPVKDIDNHIAKLEKMNIKRIVKERKVKIDKLLDE